MAPLAGSAINDKLFAVSPRHRCCIQLWNNIRINNNVYFVVQYNIYDCAASDYLLIKIKGILIFLCQDLYLQSLATYQSAWSHLQSLATYQSAWSQSSHEDCGPSVGCLTPCLPDPSVTLRETELAGAVAQCVIHDTASQDKALWHRVQGNVQGWRGK